MEGQEDNRLGHKPKRDVRKAAVRSCKIPLRYPDGENTLGEKVKGKGRPGWFGSEEIFSVICSKEVFKDSNPSLVA